MSDIEKGTVGSSFADFQRITELEAQLAKVTAERDAMHMQSTDLINDTVSMGIARDEAYNRAETYRAAIPVAYQMALDAAKKIADEVADDGKYFGEVSVDTTDAIYRGGALEVAESVDALTPPVDLVEQATAKAKETK